MTQNLDLIIKESGAKSGDIFVFEHMIYYLSTYDDTKIFRCLKYEHIHIFDFKSLNEKLLSIWRPLANFFDPPKWFIQDAHSPLRLTSFDFELIWLTPKEEVKPKKTITIAYDSDKDIEVFINGVTYKRVDK